MNTTTRTFDSISAEYRNDFAYLSDHQYELLCMSAAQNYDPSTGQTELETYGASLESFSQWTKEEILEIVQPPIVTNHLRANT